LNRLGFVLSSRGLRNSAARAWQVATRFGVTAARMERRLLAYSDIVGEYGGRPSLPITAVVLERNPQVARRLVDRGVELCVHGLVHTDMSLLPAETQEEHIRRAIGIFKEHGIEFEGFRSPYLKFNRDTLVAVEKTGFKYDSNLPFYWEPVESLEHLASEEADGLSRGLRFYRPVKYPAERSLPRYSGDIVEIPVSLPDDEIMLDRMGLPSGRIGDTWMEMAGQALARRELLTIQLHPERVLHLEGALRRVLEFASEGASFWIATMREIAAWWDARMQASLEIVPGEGDEHRVTLSGPEELGLEVREPLSGLSRELSPDGCLRTATRPVIGLPEGAPIGFRRNIRQSGYFYEITEDKGNVGLYIDHEVEVDGLERTIAQCPNPLVADTRWPAAKRAALAVTGDIDCLTLGDFLRRFREG
jgi:peptidoglycan/xylan/chitin deacetylase (PgdA/CDA1 family)